MQPVQTIQPVQEKQIVKEASPGFQSSSKFSGNIGLKNAPAPVQTTQVKESNPDITIEDIRSRWVDLLNEVMKSNRINIRTILAAANLLSFENNTLTFTCINSFNADLLISAKSFILEKIEAVFKARFNFHPVVSESSETPQFIPLQEEPDNSPKAQKPVSNPNTVEADHPVVQALMREFGAEPII